MSDYARIAQAIEYIQQHALAQPTLHDIARHVHLSPYHFQRLFTRWAGTTPKRFLQVLTLERGKQWLDRQHSILQVAHDTGLSSASRLHDHFVQLEAVTPGEYKRKGHGLHIRHGTCESAFGELFVAQTPRGICRAAFLNQGNHTQELAILRATWPLATLIADRHPAEQFAARMTQLAANKKLKAGAAIHLHVAGTNFQLAVWRALLRIPVGTAVSYGELAKHVGKPTASRAVGTAVGSNPVAFLIPCHRVIQQSGALGGYRWGVERKQALQVWEQLV